MKIHCEWTGALQFKGGVDQHSVLMDAKPPLGSGTAPTPKEYLLMAVCGCTGMDVSALLKKNKQVVEAFTIYAEAQVATSHPAVFTELELVYELEGEIDPQQAMNAVTKSMTEYCSVTAMISKVTQINYRVEVNGLEVGKGEAAFKI